MHKNILLAVGITILFLGVAVQPCLATIQLVDVDVEPDKSENKLYIPFMIGCIWGTYTYHYTELGALFYICELGGLKAFVFEKGVGFRFYKSFTEVDTTAPPLGIIKGDDNGGSMRVIMFWGSLRN